ncbi:MAG: thioredoxin family protein [Rhodothermales bacterium]|nr:thioredoxin family protein [Rhodothermales bacterium]
MIRLPPISLLLVASAAAAQPALPWGSFPAALADAAASGRPVLVYAYADWCAPCHRLERETFADAAVRGRLARFALARLDFDDRESAQQVGPYRLSPAAWAERLGAEATPALVFLTADGAVLGRVAGFLEPAALLPLLDAALADAPR